MKSFVVNSNSWHFRFLNKLTDGAHRIDNTCEYIRKLVFLTVGLAIMVCGVTFVAGLFLTPLVLAIGYILGFDLGEEGMKIMVTGLATYLAFVAIAGFIALCVWLQRRVTRRYAAVEEKLEAIANGEAERPETTSFFEMLVTWHSKICRKVEIVRD